MSGGPGPGDELGRYLLGEELGAGGMATVFRARDRELRRDVAVKVLFPHLARKEEVVRRFQREARAAAALEHPNILRVYDVGGGGALPPFIVMELVRGGTLKEVTDGPELLAEHVACVGALVCEALAVAHAAGIVHRDVKPGNVMFADDGRLLLTDFGVAHLDDDDSLVTRTGALLGTPAFMAPEQALGQGVDARSDLYAVGATLYQLATGSMPYTGPTAKIVTEAQKGSATPAVRRRPAVGSELSRAIARLMDPDPAKRPASAAAAAGELRAIAEAGGIEDAAAELRALAADRDGCTAARTTGIVTRLVERAEAARARRALPLAIALCDRALAMAPADARVQALEAALAKGGGGRRAVVAGVAAVALAGAAGGVWMMMGGGGGAGERVADAPFDSGLADARPVLGANGEEEDAAPFDSGLADARPTLRANGEEDAGRFDSGLADARPALGASGEADAGTGARSGARTAIDAAAARVPIDAGAVDVLAIDAAALPSPPIDAAAPAAPALVEVRFTFDTWCNLTIDDVDHGRANRTATVRLAPGAHRATCSQGKGLAAWSRTIDVVAGRVNAVQGDVLPTVEVVIAAGDEVRIDGVAIARGAARAVKVGPHVVEVVTGGKVVATARVTLPAVARCTLRDRPSLGCYP